MPIACFFIPEFGISCERKRRTLPSSEPLALVDKDNRVCATSPEARARGVRNGQMATAARAFCDTLATLPYDHEAYEAAAAPVRDLYAIESSFVEPVSPEICLVDMAGPDPTQRTRGLAEVAAQVAGAPVMAGMGRTAMVARLAAQGCTHAEGAEAAFELAAVPRGMEEAFLSPVPLAAIPEIPPDFVERMRRLGIKSLGDVLAISGKELTSRFKENGLRLQRFARGDDGRRIRAIWPYRELEGVVRFEEPTIQQAWIEDALRRCAGKIAPQLDQRGEFCRTIRLTLAQEGQGPLIQEERLKIALHEEKEIHRAALRLLARMAITHPISSIRLQAADLGYARGVQLALLDDNASLRGLPHERKDKLDQALQLVTKRYGAATVNTAQALRSPREIHLWTYALGHAVARQVNVATDQEGRPQRYWLEGRPWEITHIQNQWNEMGWSMGRLGQTTVYRVETDPIGLSELHRSNDGWRLAAIAD